MEQSGMPLLVVPGAFSSGGGFERMASWFETAGWDARIVRLPAIDATLDDAVGASRRPPVVVGHSLGGLAACS